MNQRMPMRRGRLRGYSLVELLVVIAIIGMISLVAVPQFMTMYRSSKMKGAVRDFTNKLRATQQLAVTSNVMTEVRFRLNSASFTIWKQTTDPTTYQLTWTQQGGTYSLENTGAAQTAPSVYFTDTNFDAAGGWNLIDFSSNGTITMPTNMSGSPNPFLKLHTDDQIPYPTYTITIQANGTITTVNQ